MSTEEEPTPVQVKVNEIIALLSKMEGHQAHHAVLGICQSLVGTLCDVESLGVCRELMMDVEGAVEETKRQGGEKDSAG